MYIAGVTTDPVEIGWYLSCRHDHLPLIDAWGERLAAGSSLQSFKP